MLKILLIVFVILSVFKCILMRLNANGTLGEWLVALWLKIGLDKNQYRILNNVIIPDDSNGTTQIDHIVLSPYGLFVIETKTMKGWIFGDEGSAKWMQQIYKSKNQFQNPFRQNYKHIICLSNLTGLSKENFIHVIAFVGECEIKTKDTLPDSLVTGGRSLLSYIGKFSILRFTSADLDLIQSAILSGRIKNSFENQRTHVAHVKKIVETKERALVPVCPKCGAKMIRRQTKSGVNAGKSFWGCPNYPKCRGIVND